MSTTNVSQIIDLAVGLCDRRKEISIRGRGGGLARIHEHR